MEEQKIFDVIIPPTLPTFGHATVLVFPTVSPRVVVVPIISCIIGFPVLVMLIICGLRYRARRARMAAKKGHVVEMTPLDLTSGPSILSSRCSNGGKGAMRMKRKKVVVRFKPMPEIDLDTVVEEKSEFDAEVTASDLLTTPEELELPEEPTPPASFRAYRYMGAVSGGPVGAQPPSPPVKTSPYRAPPILPNLTEEAEVYDNYDVEMPALELSDDEEEMDFYDEDELDEYEENEEVEIEAAMSKEEEKGSGGSSDSDNTGKCFPLSPKQVSKSPTGVHLALKKLDGAVKRRHSSPVKMHYESAKNRGHPQRSSTKAPVHTKETKKREDTLQLPNSDYDYIDRELMPSLQISSSSPRRSHSVKYTNNRRSTSFTGKKRRGESFKLRSKSFSRSISHVHDDKLKGQHRSASTSQDFQNGVHVCDVHVVNENGARSNTSCDLTYSSMSDEFCSSVSQDTLHNSSENEWVKEGLCSSKSVPIRERRESKSPPKRLPLSPKNIRANLGVFRTYSDSAHERTNKCNREENISQNISQISLSLSPTAVEINAGREKFHRQSLEDGNVGNCKEDNLQRDEKSTLV